MQKDIVSDTDRFPQRKSPRMGHYSYTTPNYYFVTICTKDKSCIFWDTTAPNRYGTIAEEGILSIPGHFPGVRVDKYVIMPNHIHAIIVLESNNVDLSVIIGQYKSFVSRKIHATLSNIPVWQASFHDHVIRNQRSYEKIWNYIDANPSKWHDDCFYTP